MRKIICISIAAVGLGLIETGTAEARDGCGPGWFNNGRGCVSQHRAHGPRYDRPGYRSYAQSGTLVPAAVANSATGVRTTWPAPNPGNPCGDPYLTIQEGACRGY